MRFLKRLWTLVLDHVNKGDVPDLDVGALSDAGKDLRRKTHTTLAKADDDYGRRLQFNTVVSAVMELANEVARVDSEVAADRAAVQEALVSATLIISPIAPHIAHRLWSELGQQGDLVNQPWPQIDEDALTQQRLSLVVQVNGKVRGQIDVAADASQGDILETAKHEENVARHLDGKTVRKEIYVPNKLVNIVVG